MFRVSLGLLMEPQNNTGFWEFPSLSRPIFILHSLYTDAANHPSPPNIHTLRPSHFSEPARGEGELTLISCYVNGTVLPRLGFYTGINPGQHPVGYCEIGQLLLDTCFPV